MEITLISANSGRIDIADAGGEVSAIDSAGFGPITITKAVQFDTGRVDPPGSLLSR
jgi:hypothetical protein